MTLQHLPSPSVRYSTPLQVGPGPGHPGLQYAVWVPGVDGQPSSALLIAHQNNLHYRPRADRAESYPITADGQPGLLHHGVSDPLYRGKLVNILGLSWYAIEACRFTERC